jgi:hypothetical protein
MNKKATISLQSTIVALLIFGFIVTGASFMILNGFNEYGITDTTTDLDNLNKFVNETEDLVLVDASNQTSFAPNEDDTNEAGLLGAVGIFNKLYSIRDKYKAVTTLLATSLDFVPSWMWNTFLTVVIIAILWAVIFFWAKVKP